MNNSEQREIFNGFSVSEWELWLSKGYSVPTRLSLGARERLYAASASTGCRLPVMDAPPVDLRRKARVSA